jgi:hypothetical protein
VAGAWPAYAAYLDRDNATGAAIAGLVMPAPAGGWTADPQPLTDWRPHYDPASATIFQVYRKGDRAVALHLGYYYTASGWLVTSLNIMVVRSTCWNNVGESAWMRPFAGRFSPRQTAAPPQQRLLVWTGSASPDTTYQSIPGQGHEVAKPPTVATAGRRSFWRRRTTTTANPDRTCANSQRQKPRRSCALHVSKQTGVD